MSQHVTSLLYHLQRGGKVDVTRDKIMTCAEAIFTRKGLYESSMEDIATLAQVARRTLYRYFKTKEELAYEVAESLMRQNNTYQKEIFQGLEGSGIEKFQIFLSKLTNYMIMHKEHMCFFSEFDFYFKDSRDKNISVEKLEEFYKIASLSENLIGQLVQQGLEDGSMLLGLKWNTETFILTMTNVLWSFGQRVAMRQRQIKEEFHIESMNLLECQIQMYIELIANKEGRG